MNSFSRSLRMWIHQNLTAFSGLEQLECLKKKVQSALSTRATLPHCNWHCNAAWVALVSRVSIYHRLRYAIFKGCYYPTSVFRHFHFSRWPLLNHWNDQKNLLPPMCPGFDSRTRRHMWAEFVGSLLCSERFFSGYSLIKNQYLIWFVIRLLDTSWYQLIVWSADWSFQDTLLLSAISDTNT